MQWMPLDHSRCVSTTSSYNALQNAEILVTDCVTRHVTLDTSQCDLSCCPTRLIFSRQVSKAQAQHERHRFELVVKFFVTRP